MQNSISLQMENNQVMAHKLGCPELTAFINANHVAKCLEVNVSDNLFTSLVHLCYRVGANTFSKSVILEQVNNSGNQVKICKCIKSIIKSGDMVCTN